MTVIDTPEGIRFVQLVARRGALKLELIGLKRRGRTAYSICKQVYKLKGSRTNVLEQLNGMIAEAHQANRARARVEPVRECVGCGAAVHYAWGQAPAQDDAVICSGCS